MTDPFSTLVAAASNQLPEDVGKAGPLGLLLIIVLLIAVALLVRSMSGHLKKIPNSFDPAQRVPDSPAELMEPSRTAGQDLLDELRRAPRAIEPPRREGGRPETPGPASG